tara:strand:- start:2601 stop:3185 length:585 start_codon:yes stop_codon:yes gene_type:complete
MCEPATIMMAASAAMSLYQGVQQNKQAKAQANYQRQVGEVNAAESKNQATRISNEGVRTENAQRRATAELASKQKASLGAKGIQVDSGSAQAIQSDTIELGNLDAMQIRENARIEADSVNRQGIQNQWKANVEADQTRAAGKDALIGGALTAASTVVSSKWFSEKSAAFSSRGASNNVNGYAGGGNIHQTAYGR